MSDQRVTILHIDDLEEHRYIVRKILTKEGFKVLEAATGKDGLILAEKAQPDLIILDIKLPDLNGFKVCQAIKAIPNLNFTPILHLSSHFRTNEDKAFGLEGGADSYLLYPADPIVLIATVRALLRIRRAEEALRASLKREQEARAKAEETAALLEGILMNSPLGIAFFDLDFRFIKVNSALADINGLPIDAHIGQTLDHIIPSIWPKIRQKFEEVRNEGKPLIMHDLSGVTAAAPNETRYWIQNIYPVWHPSGKMIGLGGVVMDITDRKRAEEELRASEERFRFLADTVPQIVWTATPDGSRDYLNKGWTEITGATPEEGYGANWLDLLHDQDRKNAWQTWQNAVKNCENYESQMRIKQGKDGDYRWYLCRAVPLKKDNQSVVKWFGTCTDINSQKMIESRQRFLAKANRVLSETLNHEVILTRLCQLAVPKIADFSAVFIQKENSIKQVAISHLNQTKTDLDLFLTQKNTSYGVAKVLKTGEPEFLPYINEEFIHSIASDQEHCHAIKSLGLESYLCVPIKIGHQIIGAFELVQTESKRRFTADDLAFVSDLLSRVSIALENAKLYEETKRANRAKDEFLATLSHELRTPLNVIVGYSELVLQDDISEEEKKLSLKAIHRNAHLQSQLINDLLDVSRIISGKMVLDTKEADLSKLINMAVDSVSLSAKSKGIQIKVWHDCAMCVINGDEARLQQVLWNLLSNAIKFTPSNGIIEISLDQHNTNARIRIRDTGIGIEREFLPYIFERFQQEDGKSARRFGGLGLGLAIVKHLVELHGGTISVQSQGKGLGSVFTICLPVISFSQKHLEKNLDKPKEFSILGNNVSYLPKRNILDEVAIFFIDDESDTRSLVSRILARAGAKIHAFPSSQTALEQLASSTKWPDIIVCDIGMPDEDGYYFIRQLRSFKHSQAKHIPVIALTAYASKDDYKKAIHEGFNDHLAKPVQAEKLLEAVMTYSPYLKIKSE